MFSKTCEYGIKSSIYVALKSLEGRRVSLKEIAGEIDSPVAFTAKILQLLSKNGIIDSVKGAHGGFEISKARIDSIKLSEIVKAIDGDRLYSGCGLGLKECNALKPCPVHDKFVEIRNDLRLMLENTSLFELTAGLEVGLTYLKR
jgi:Rrf2 family protein